MGGMGRTLSFLFFLPLWLATSNRLGSRLLLRDARFFFWNRFSSFFLRIGRIVAMQ
jgi:hypothetical protein